MIHPIRIDTINTLMSLRLPQYKSLEVLEDILKTIDLKGSLDDLSNTIHTQYPIFKEFERSFPSMTFALATGVGKTLLMGAFITYLYTNYGIKNFFIVAPNLTIYNKLVKDFGSPSYEKYVFKRIQPFIQNPPRIVTGDNFKEQVVGQTSLWNSVTINIFNIGKINAEVRNGSLPLVKKLSEYIGESYFDYLVKLPDLVMLMDESHHYRADRGMTVINELNPLLGLELTATPQVETSTGANKFKNVVYEYSLAKAIVDGYVKEPVAATRREFEPDRFTDDEIDKIKLLDGIRIHRNTKAELEAYAENSTPKRRIVKPFVLVVCKDTSHAAVTKEYIESKDFYNGYYSDKVLEIHSAQKGRERDDNISKLLSLESDENNIEIVIHVNMLKEGWDVTNLYTIIPLRTATSLTLREQTIGRGLRLPYGNITYNPGVDRLTIVAHDKFEQLIKEASEESSIIRRENIISIEDEEDLTREKEVVKSRPLSEAVNEEKEKELEFARSNEQIQAIKEEIEISNAINDSINEVLTQNIDFILPLKGFTDEEAKLDSKITTESLLDSKIQSKVIDLAKNKLNKEISKVQEDSMKSILSSVISQKIKYTIDIPEVSVFTKGIPKINYIDFDLDSSTWTAFPVPSDEIMVESLKDNSVSIYNPTNDNRLSIDTYKLLLDEILSLDMTIDYELVSDLLYKLIRQAILYFENSHDETKCSILIQFHRKELAKRIVNQLNDHKRIEEPEFELKLIKAVSPILQEDYTKYKDEEIANYTDTIPASKIKKTVVDYYKKACHNIYKFDSVPEHVFSMVLERDDTVKKWLRPARRQFKIRWSGSHEYDPDFIVETLNNIYMVEIKAERDIKSKDVLLKAKAGISYCNNVNLLLSGSKHKKWMYCLIKDNNVSRNSSFDFLVKTAEEIF